MKRSVSGPEPGCATTSLRRAVIGIGHDYRCDDAVGLVVAREIAARPPDGIEVVCLGEDVLRMIDLMQPGAHLVVIDAVVGAAPPGSILCIDLLNHLTGSVRTAGSTHGVTIAQVLALATILERKPAMLQLVGIAVADTAVGAGLSPRVAGAVDAAAAVVRRVIDRSA